MIGQQENVLSSPPNILFIDDNRANNFLVETIIKLDSIPVIPHFEIDAIRAIEYLERLQNMAEFPSFIFVDINMPRKNGFEFIEDFIAEFPERYHLVNIYILSTSITPKDRQRANMLKIIQDCLEKPLKTQQLRSIIGLIPD